MRNKYLYRIYRLRRMIVLSTVVGVSLFFLAWLISEQRYHSILEQKDVLVWSLGFFAAINTAQMMFFPKVAGEIFRISCTLGLAMVVIAIFSNALAGDVDAFSGKAKFGVIVTYIVFWWIIFSYLNKKSRLLMMLGLVRPIKINQDIWIKTTPDIFYNAIHIHETQSPWSPSIGKIERLAGSSARYRIFHKTPTWDVGESRFKPDLTPIISEVISTEKDISESIVSWDEQGNMTTIQSYLITPMGGGLTYSTVEETRLLPALLLLFFWLVDGRGDYFFHMKEYFEHKNRIAIMATDHQPYLMVWVAFLLHKLTTNDEFRG